MQTIRFGKKEDSNVIDIDDVVESQCKIYCCHIGKELRFLVCKNGGYHWTDLSNNCDRFIKFSTFKDALNCYTYETAKVLIFDSQCEVLEYAKKM